MTTKRFNYFFLFNDKKSGKNIPFLRNLWFLCNWKEKQKAKKR